MTTLESLQPHDVLRFFEILSNIPRGSENEKQAADWVVNFAEERGLTAFQDDERRAGMIEQMLRNDPRPPPRARLAARVALIRKQGFEEHVSDTLPGITVLCFPIVDRGGHAVATLTQPYLHQRDVTVSVAKARLAHQRIAAAISLELGAFAGETESP